MKADAEETAALWKGFRERGCQKCRAALIERYAHLASVTAAKCSMRLPAYMDRNDLVGTGLIALVRAVDTFDPNRGVQFSSYAITLMRGAILEFKRDNDWVPRHLREVQKEFSGARQRLVSQLGRAPEAEELGREVGLTAQGMHAEQRLLARMAVASLDAPLEETGTLSLSSVLPTEQLSPCAQALLSERLHRLCAAIRRLPKREGVVVSLYYREEQTFKVIGQRLGISESRAYQLHRQAITRLQGTLQADEELMQI